MLPLLTRFSHAFHSPTVHWSLGQSNSQTADSSGTSWTIRFLILCHSRRKGLIFLSCCPDISVPPATHASLGVDSKYARLNALVIPTRGMGQQLAKGLWPFSFVPM